MRVYTTRDELLGKVQWEGGLYDAAFGYGIRSSDINAEALPAIHAAWREMEEAYEKHFGPAFERVQELLGED